jgi:hypothetical protein
MNADVERPGVVVSASTGAELEHRS